MTCVDLFSGIRHTANAAKELPITTRLFCEINAYKQTILSHHYPGVPIHDDIRSLTIDAFRTYGISTCDLITGGFPCTDISVAGSGQGLDGKSLGLWREMHRIVQSLSPKWVLIENVPRLLSINNGRDFSTIINDLQKCGYGVAWRVFDAQFAGVPQRRRRLFIVGHLGDGRAAKVLLECDSLRRHPPTRRPEEKVSPTLVASGVGAGRTGNTNNETEFCIVFEENQRSEVREIDDRAGCLKAQRSGSNQTYIARCLTRREGSRHNHTQDTYLLSDLGVRRLMPVECERLMGLPDGYTFGSDTQRYSALGDGIVVPVIRPILESILKES